MEPNRTATRPVSPPAYEEDISIPLLKEYLALLVLGGLGCVCAALFTYHTQDATPWEQVLGVGGVPETAVHNVMGSLGAQLAYGAYSLFGTAAPLLACVMFFQTAYFFWQKKAFYRKIFLLKLFGYPQFFLCYTTFVAIVMPRVPFVHVPWHSGGLVGDQLSQALVRVMGPKGSAALMAIGLLASLTLVFAIGPVSTVLWCLNQLPWRRSQEAARLFKD